MVDIDELLPELRDLVEILTEAMRIRIDDVSEIAEGLRNAYQQIEKGGRTAQAFESWLTDYLDQVAVAWVLSCVFVRFIEDNGLIVECWLAGEGPRRTKAENEHELYFRDNPHCSDREYFAHVFREVGKIPACADLFAEGKTPVWALGPTGDAAMQLLEFWREIDSETGALKRKFITENCDTRFLGDLYQELSVAAQKKYALKQTPTFVEEFILDRTLNPAIDEFGLDEVRMIDPTCGSGHFLLGAFGRLFPLWLKVVGNETAAAQKALDGIWGVDVNPFAVAIARFRLVVEALTACGLTNLRSAPGWKIHLAVGDSLLFGSRWTGDGEKVTEQRWFATDESWAPEIYACEDHEEIAEILGQQYHAVVGNPPYITVKDSKLSKAYKQRFPKSCHRQYSLGVPFTERFFDLAISQADRRCGFVGMITANSFMKREFGTKLIANFFKRVDLSHVIDTSGAFIPGHGTPTVILFGRNRTSRNDTVRGVLGIRGEPETPDRPELGLVWQSIVKNIDHADQQDEFISTEDVPRKVFYKHPWSLTGGGARETKDEIEGSCSTTLNEVIGVIGYICMTRMDDVYLSDPDSLTRQRVPAANQITMIAGNTIRDWEVSGTETALFPYDSDLSPIDPVNTSPLVRFLWPHRSALWLRKEPNGNHRKLGITWFEWSRFQKERFRQKNAIGYAEIASHNHFVFDHSGRAFNQTAPVIKLPDNATEEQYFRLLGYLTSSSMCFWMKEVSHQKQMTGGDGVRIESRARVPYQFASTALKKMPIPDCIAESGPLGDHIQAIAQRLHFHSQQLEELNAEKVLRRWLASSDEFEQLWKDVEATRSQHRSAMVGLQEELDYTTYVIFQFIDESYLSPNVDSVFVEAVVGERPFELHCGRNEDGASVPSEFPKAWPAEVRSLWERRKAAISDIKQLTLLEDAHYKRRWVGRQGLFNHSAREDEVAVAARLILLEMVEHCFADVESVPTLRSTAQLSDQLSRDHLFRRVAALVMGREDFDASQLVTELVKDESVPILPILVYTTKGLRKRKNWEETWRRQREEDATNEDFVLKAPPTYAAEEFASPAFSRLRGKCDVHRERFISLPFCEDDSDSSPVVGWAGWDHVQQATAIVAYFDIRKRGGWTCERLIPLLAVLDQLLPWIHQWHPEIDPEYNETAGTSFQTFLDSEAQELGLTLDQIRNWTPPKKTTKRKSKNS